MQLAHAARALRAVTTREIVKFVQQRGRLLSALVRPLMWLAVFAARFYNVFGVSIIPPYKTYITYQVYIVPGLLRILLLFHGMQSSLSMVYDREMGVMRLLLTAPLPRWVLLACKLAAGTALSVLTCYVFLAVCILFDVTFDWQGWLTVLPALIVSGLMLGALWLFLSVYIKQVENFAGAMNFVMFPMFFFSSALYPLWKLREGGSEALYIVSLINPFTHAVELIRFALYGLFEPVAAAVVAGSTVLFFLLAVHGYDPQRGMLRRMAPVGGNQYFALPGGGEAGLARISLAAGRELALGADEPLGLADGKLCAELDLGGIARGARAIHCERSPRQGNECRADLAGRAELVHPRQARVGRHRDSVGQEHAAVDLSTEERRQRGRGLC